MPSPNINATDSMEVGRQKINAHFNDTTPPAAPTGLTATVETI